MGGITSTFQNNAELVDNLIMSRFIKSEKVERIFRAVDRGDFFPKEERKNAYRDLAWNSGNIHISSPCIYSQIMEHFKLSPGLTFLNLGSGTGYLSTMVGLIVGPKGINHGVEINEYLVEYAHEKVDEFERTSTALDEYEFCRPTFIYGNCFCLSPEFPRYDRVYCGAACPKSFENYMKNLIKVKGILIMVIDGILTSYTRTSEDTWVIKHLRSIYFASFVAPGSEKVEIFKNQPNSLQSLCRITIRTTLRNNIEKKFADEIERAQSVYVPQRKKRRVLAPIGEGSYLETIDSRNETYLMTLLDGFRNQANTMRPRSLIDQVIFNEFAREPTFRAAASDNPSLTGNSSGESSSEEGSSSNNSNQSPSNTQNISVAEQQQPSTSASTATVTHGVPASSRNRNLTRTRHYYWRQEPEVVITDDSDDEPVPVLSVSTLGPYGQNICRTDSTDESADVNVVDVDETVPGNGQPEAARNVSRSEDTDTDIILYEGPVDNEYKSPYTPYMRAKIQALPLPSKLKRYINLNRDFD